MFGTATLSCAAGIACETGDIFEISAPDFGPALRNPVRMSGNLSIKGQTAKRQAVAVF